MSLKKVKSISAHGGLKAYLGADTYAAITPLFDAGFSCVKIALFLKINGYTDTLKDRRTISYWKHIYNTEKQS